MAYILCKRQLSFSIFCICLFVSPSQCVMTRSMWYTTKFKYTYGLGRTLSDKQVVGSKTACGQACLEQGNCMTFYYDEDTSECHMLDEVLTEPSHTVWGIDKHCPEALGYKMYVKDFIVLCLNVVTSTATKSNADSACASTGGHQVLVRDSSMLSYLDEILADAFNPNYCVYINGEDTFTNGTYFSHLGTTIPYEDWAFPNGAAKYCIIVYLGRMQPKDCTAAHPYVCQIG